MSPGAVRGPGGAVRWAATVNQVRCVGPERPLCAGDPGTGLEEGEGAGTRSRWRFLWHPLLGHLSQGSVTRPFQNLGLEKNAVIPITLTRSPVRPVVCCMCHEGHGGGSGTLRLYPQMYEAS
ncbi:unnamed protein product [Rangifer tarandus platyrhynchus]|uniref:Uncharacterized protein n=1 Tax=Rangifer tarandus platyrhynchus TaxID=3082113 RepID=A0ABN8XWE1_RANTA|nr:unnamed protein product [Rangifer tarandus platyrhynchus]